MNSVNTQTTSLKIVPRITGFNRQGQGKYKPMRAATKQRMSNVSLAKSVVQREIRRNDEAGKFDKKTAKEAFRYVLDIIQGTKLKEAI